MGTCNRRHTLSELEVLSPSASGSSWMLFRDGVKMLKTDWREANVGIPLITCSKSATVQDFTISMRVYKYSRTSPGVWSESECDMATLLEAGDRNLISRKRKWKDLLSWVLEWSWMNVSYGRISPCVSGDRLWLVVWMWMNSWIRGTADAVAAVRRRNGSQNLFLKICMPQAPCELAPLRMQWMLPKSVWKGINHI